MLDARSRNLDKHNGEENVEASGNAIAVVEEKKELNSIDRKQLMKQRKEMLKRGEDTYDIDQQLGIE